MVTFFGCADYVLHNFSSVFYLYIYSISGVVGTHRFCSSRDMGDQCQDIWFPDHDRMYRACVYTCSGDGCNSATRLSTLPAVLVSLLWLIVHVWRRLWWVRVVGVGECGELGLHLGWIGVEVEPGWVGLGGGGRVSWKSMFESGQKYVCMIWKLAWWPHKKWFQKLALSVYFLREMWSSDR